MAFAMTTLKRLKSGAFTARKTISKDALGECREVLAEDGKSDFMPTSAHRLARLREPSTSGSRKLKAASKPFEMLRLQWGIAQGHLSRMCHEVIVKVSGTLGWSVGPAVPV